MNAIERLANFIVQTHFETIPEAVIEKAKEGVIDFLGCVLAGSQSLVGRKVTEYVRLQGGKEEATVIGMGFKTSPSLAGLANGVMAHADDFDDVSFSVPGHPSVPVLPAVLGLGEAKGISGRDLLTAYTIGFEVECKVGRSLAPHLYQRGWHATSVLGSLGAAAASSRILGLKREEVIHCLGIAASMASGLRANLGSMTKPLHIGLAAQNGIVAASLAEKGLTANPQALEGNAGLFPAFAGTWDMSLGIDHLGNPFDLISPGITFKQYPSCAETHPALDAVIGLMNENQIEPDDILAIDCTVTPMDRDVLVYHRPQNATEAKFSFEFCVAIGVLERKASLPQFVDGKVKDPKILALMEKIKMEADSKLSPDGYTGASTIVALKLKDGTLLTRRVDQPKGDPENPFSGEEFLDKFKGCASLTLDPDTMGKVVEKMLLVEKLKSIKHLMKHLSGGKKKE
jgi:2-methylcitrate dehydratase PrpD